MVKAAWQPCSDKLNFCWKVELQSWFCWFTSAISSLFDVTYSYLKLLTVTLSNFARQVSSTKVTYAIRWHQLPPNFNLCHQFTQVSTFLADKGSERCVWTLGRHPYNFCQRSGTFNLQYLRKSIFLRQLPHVSDVIDLDWVLWLQEMDRKHMTPSSPPQRKPQDVIHKLVVPKFGASSGIMSFKVVLEV